MIEVLLCREAVSYDRGTPVGADRMLFSCRRRAALTPLPGVPGWRGSGLRLRVQGSGLSRQISTMHPGDQLAVSSI